MKTITQTQIARAGALLLSCGLLGCSMSDSGSPNDPFVVEASQIVIESSPDTSRPPFDFDADDEALLDEIQRATFTYFMEAVSPETGMVYDRTSSDVVSVAGVGFQLAALPIGVERGWITKEQGAARARLILDALMKEPSNRKGGLFYHFINPHDASARRVGRELVVSTVDSAILFSGMLVAGQYFEGDIKTDADLLFAQADWTYFLAEPGGGAPDGSFLSLGWKPSSDDAPTGEGELLPYFWLDAGDEHRMTTLLGVSATDAEHRVDPSVYWSLRRQLGYHEGQGHLVWFPYSGALFTSFFAHLFIDYNAMGTDNPAQHGQMQRAQVDWWENSRRTVEMHRDRAIENPLGLPTLGPDAWGFSASDGPEGYLVSGQFPQGVEMVGSVPGRDFSTYQPSENWGDGVIAPYAPGTSIMFTPHHSVDALRFAIQAGRTRPDSMLWQGNAMGGWGFRDAFRLDDNGDMQWVAEDYVAISQGPLILGIENARSGLIWRLFMSHPFIQAGLDRLDMDTRP